MTEKRIPVVSEARIGKVWTAANHAQLVKDYNELHAVAGMVFPGTRYQVAFVSMMLACIRARPGAPLWGCIASAMAMCGLPEATWRGLRLTRPPGIPDALVYTPEETCFKGIAARAGEYLKQSKLIDYSVETGCARAVERADLPKSLQPTPELEETARALLAVWDEKETIFKRAV